MGGATGSLINFFVNLFVGLASGTTVVIAQGVRCARRRERRRYGAYLGGAGSGRGAWSYSSRRGGRALALTPWHPADIMDFALTYLRVYMLGTIPSFLYNVGSGILRAVGDTRRRCTSSSSRAW